MSTKAELALKSALLSTGLVQPVDSNSKGKALEILCRQIPGQEKNWLGVIRDMLVLSETPVPTEGGGFELHVCRRYLMKDSDMVFGWHIGVAAKSAKGLDEVVKMLNGILAEARPSLVPETRPQRQQMPRVSEGPVQRPSRPLPPGRHPPQRQARPRPPGEESTIANEAPEDFTPALRVVRSGRDASGKPFEETEMPLPHVYSELNVPTEGGRGATLWSEAHPSQRRRR